MNIKGLLFSFLGVGTVTSAIIGTYCSLNPSKSDTKDNITENKGAIQPQPSSNESGEKQTLKTPDNNPKNQDSITNTIIK